MPQNPLYDGICEVKVALAPIVSLTVAVLVTGSSIEKFLLYP
jgi:hypothetical protein